MPQVFATAYRPDVIKRVVLSLQSKKRQRYGTDPLAGKRTSAHYHGRRKYRFAMMNKEMSRLPRIHGKGAGYMAFRGRFSPQAVKGRRAHPPKAEKNWAQDVNKKEKLLALHSALSAAAMKDLVAARGHEYAGDVPLVIVDDFENVSKAKEARKILASLGLEKELERCAEKKVRAGRGKMRGRKYKRKKGPLLIAAKKCALLKAAANIPGVDAVSADELNAEHLAPGANAGRLVVMTKSALDNFSKKVLSKGKER